jgi:hypothetical protein
VRAIGNLYKERRIARIAGIAGNAVLAVVASANALAICAVAARHPVI